MSTTSLPKPTGEKDAVTSPTVTPSPPPQNRGPRFYAIIVAMVFAGTLTALEGSITSTSLPTIIADLKGGDDYVWAANGYFLAMTVFQPLMGQLANVFGRRWPIIISTVTFVLGSGICGGARNMDMLIAGRVIQGAGAGGINVLLEIITCDLVPLRERGKYLGMIFGIIALGSALGPFFGGLIVQYSSWRWVFYLNLPIGGVALVMLVMFLKVKYNKDRTLADRLADIDWLGNAVFVAAVSSILIALSWAGTIYPWSSFRVLVPLIIGIAGLIGFFFLEASPFVKQPMMPLHLVSNRTSAITFLLTFLHSIVTMWPLYFLPVYFQGVLGSSASRSGVQLLPTILFLVPAAGIGGNLLTRIGRYKPLHLISFAILIIGFGIFTLLDADSNTGTWVGFQIILAIGAGFIIPTLLPALLAPLSDNDTALATATWSFWRSFGMTWGIAIPAAVFNNRFDSIAPGRISDPQILSVTVGGRAYEHAVAGFLNTLTPESRRQIVGVFSDSLKTTWQAAIAFAALGFLVTFIEEEIPLRKELETTEFGMVEKEKDDKEKEKSDVSRTESDT